MTRPRPAGRERDRERGAVHTQEQQHEGQLRLHPACKSRALWLVCGPCAERTPSFPCVLCCRGRQPPTRSPRARARPRTCGGGGLQHRPRSASAMQHSRYCRRSDRISTGLSHSWLAPPGHPAPSSHDAGRVMQTPPAGCVATRRAACMPSHAAIMPCHTPRRPPAAAPPRARTARPQPCLCSCRRGEQNARRTAPGPPPPPPGGGGPWRVGLCTCCAAPCPRD
jgi:hypothetical protein